MQQEDKIFFSLLQKKIASVMMLSYPGIDPEISNWKGHVITDFQEDLLLLYSLSKGLSFRIHALGINTREPFIQENDSIYKGTLSFYQDSVPVSGFNQSENISG